jgi:hypothetical protein
MAVGDIRWLSQGLLDLGNKVHNLSSDALKLGLITSASPPAVDASGPHFGGSGSTNFATNQVKAGTSYPSGGVTLTGVTWALRGGVPTLRAAKITMAQDASGFTDARYAIIYNSTDASKRAIAFIDLGADRTISGGSLTLDWSGADDDILTITQS